MQVVWRGYVQSMLQAGFTSDLVLYAASGLLTYGANDGKYTSTNVTVRVSSFYVLLVLHHHLLFDCCSISLLENVSLFLQNPGFSAVCA